MTIAKRLRRIHRAWRYYNRLHYSWRLAWAKAGYEPRNAWNLP